MNKKYQKEVDPNYLFLTFIINKGFIIADFKLGTVFCINYNIHKFVSNVEIVEKSSEKFIMTFFGDKKGNMIIIRYYKNKYHYYFMRNMHSALISVIKANLKG